MRDRQVVREELCALDDSREGTSADRLMARLVLIDELYEIETALERAS